MHKITVVLQKIRVTRFFAKSTHAELTINFNDGQDKEIVKTTEIKLPEILAANILTEIRRIVRNAFQRFDGEQLYDKDIKISVENDKEVKKALTKFLSRLETNIRNVKNAKVADGYINLHNNITAMRMELKNNKQQ